MEMASVGTYVSILGPQLVELLKNWRCGLVGEGLSLGLGFEVLKDHTIPS